MNLLDERANPWRAIWFLAWPTILEQLLLTLAQYIDTAMVGSLGEKATAAIAVTTSTIWLINGLFAAVGVGFSVLVGQSIGAGDYARAETIVRQCVLAIGFIGVAATLIVQAIAPFLPSWLGADPGILDDAVAYFRIVTLVLLCNLAMQVCGSTIRCMGDTRTPLLINVLANLLNLAGNYFLISPTRTVSLLGSEVTMPGAGLGVRGAAISTAASFVVAGILIILALFSKKRPVRAKLGRKLDFRPDVWKSMVRLGLPAAFERVTLSSGQIALTAMVTGLGTMPLAAHHLAVTAEAITYLPVSGISMAATTLVAQSIGAKKRDLAARYGKLCTIGGVVFMSLMGVFLFFGSELLVSLFIDNPEVIALGGRVLKIEAFAQPCFALSMVVFGVLRGAGDTRWPFFISLVGMWIIRLPLAYGLIHLTALGLAGAWIGMASDIGARGILAAIRLRSGKWLPDPEPGEGLQEPSP